MSNSLEPSPRKPARKPAPHVQPVACLALGAAFTALVACGPSNDSRTATSATGTVGGLQVTVIVDPNDAGSAETIKLEEVRWGRLVDVFDEENRDGVASTRELRTPQRTDFLIGDFIATDGANYRLETDPITQRAELTIIADADGDYIAPLDSITQRTRYELLFEAIANSATILTINGTDTSSIPPFPLVPRNAALSLRFSDLLQPSSITSSTVRLTTGVPPLFPTEARVFADANYGAFLDGVFFPTRVIVDTTVSQFEASGGVLAVNSLGMSAGVSTGVASGVLRVPTQAAPSIGQFQVLRNLKGHTLQFTNNGPSETNTTLDIVRSFRAGRSTDPNNGFLSDSEPPTIRGVQAIALPSAPMSVAPDDSLGEIELGADPDRVFLATLDFETTACAQTPQVGDLLVVTGIQIPEIYAQVTLGSAPPQSGVVTDVRVRLLRFPAGETLAAIAAEFLMATTGRFESDFVDGPGVIGECFLQISPPPGAPPTSDLAVNARISLRFSEAIDPNSIRPFDNLRLNRTEGVSGPTDIVVGTVTNTPDLLEFRYTPSFLLEHLQADPDTDKYFFNLTGGVGGVTDLAGNPLVETLPADVKLFVNPNAVDSPTGGVVLRFDVVNEFGNLEDNSNSSSNPAPEVRGQFLRDMSRGVIVPREVTRLSQVIDLNTASTLNFGSVLNPAPAAPTPQTTPLSPRGSRLMMLWRYCDVGFAILDEETSNVDVEGLSWSPLSATVSTDFFAQFEISLAHSDRLPDEIVTATGYTVPGPFINSGLQAAFDTNLLSDPLNPKQIVHARDRGYQIDPGEQYTASTGTEMMPYPLNRTGNASNYEYFTWRDTAVIGVGGPDGGGAEVGGYLQTGFFGIPPTPLCLDASNTPQGGIFATPPTVYGVNQVRTLALPLLMEFKCFSGPSAGLNIPSTVATVGPAFRAYSTGGNNPSNLPISKNPDTEGTATGNTSLPALPGTDAVFYVGQLDVVIRISRVHTRWFDTGATLVGFPHYGGVVVEPSASEQPGGTSISLAFRGATSVTGTMDDITNANMYDPYGDPLHIFRVTDNIGTCTDQTDDTFTETTADIVPAFFNSDGTWKSDITDLDGARWIQARITFISNPDTSQRPELSTLAIPFSRG